MLALFIIAPIIFYLFMIGVFWKPMQLAVIRDCSWCELRNGEWKHYGYHAFKIVGYGQQWNNSFEMHTSAGYLALAWPVVFPVFAGRIIADQKASKAQKELANAEAARIRRDEEIAEAEHELKIAQLRARENELLDRQLGVQDR